jgi:hypothetical protein
MDGHGPHFESRTDCWLSGGWTRTRRGGWFKEAKLSYNGNLLADLSPSHSFCDCTRF